MTQFTAETVRAISLGPNDETGPLTATLPGGGHVVVWNDIDVNVLVHAQAYDAQGSPLGAPAQLFPPAQVGGYGSVVGGIATLANGTLVVSAGSYQPDPNGTSAPKWTIYQQHLDASGQPISPPTLVSSMLGDSSIGASYAGPVLAAPDGGYYIENLLTERPSPRSGYYGTLQRFDAAGNAMGDPFFVGGGAAFPDVAVLANGNIISVDSPLVVANIPTVTISVYDAQGHPVSQASIGSPTDYTTSNSAPRVEALRNGNALVEWTHFDSSRGNVVEVQAVDPSGQLLGSPHVLVAPAVPGYSLTALADGGALAWWNTSTGYQAEYVDGAGNPSGELIALGTDVASIAATPDGGFIVDFVHRGDTTGRDIYEQKYDPVAAGPVPGGHIDVNGGITVIPAGNYTISGTAGIDQIAFAGAHTQYTVTATQVSGPEGTDLLTSIERIRFGDGFATALDVSGDAGMAYRLYQAAFHRAPDLAGLGYHIYDLDRGVSLSTVAAHFIESPEFQSTYGSVDNTQFITLLYENVLHREPDSGGLQFHLDEFAHGQSRADMLTHFSESPENQANVIGQIENGMSYVPLV